MRDPFPDDPSIAPEEWLTMSWWPLGREATVMPGPVGHEQEIVVNIDGYDWDHHIPSFVVEVFAAQLPESWKVESRSTRIEVHPSGRFAGGYHEDDVHAVIRALLELGLNVAAEA
jgi:hypothetical protein